MSTTADNNARYTLYNEVLDMMNARGLRADRGNIILFLASMHSRYVETKREDHRLFKPVTAELLRISKIRT